MGFKGKKFKEYLEILPELQDYEVEIILNSGESFVVENKLGKQGSLRVLQNHLGKNYETKEKIDLGQFCEYYIEWQNDKTTHETIEFLDKFNTERGIIKRI